jgi:hypothetical protein
VYLLSAVNDDLSMPTERLFTSLSDIKKERRKKGRDTAWSPHEGRPTKSGIYSDIGSLSLPPSYAKPTHV